VAAQRRAIARLKRQAAAGIGRGGDNSLMAVQILLGGSF